SKGIRGDNQISGGIVRFPGPITATDVAGTVTFDGNIVNANLTGRSLGGPITGTGTVNIRKQHYEFRVEGTPTLPALAANWNLKLPVEGSGPLVLEGRGWQQIVLKGKYNGTGKLLSEPLTYRGTLDFNKIFRLNADADGRLFDRTFSANVVLEGSDYRVNLTDALGSELRLSGRGSNTSGSGTLTWPKPLQGAAEVKFSSVGSRWNAAVTSENVGLPAAKPFSLSGNLNGNGNDVSGQLGSLGLNGSWNDLRFQLSGLEMLVGSLSGTGSLKEGRLAADLDYDSPYTKFPVAVRQDGKIWRITNAYANGTFQNSVFDLSLRDLPLQIGEALKLSGNVRYANNDLSGQWNLNSERVSVQGLLEGLSTRYQGQVKTPLGNLPLTGTADNKGVNAKLGTLIIAAGGADGVKISGPLKLGFVSAQTDLVLRDGNYVGTAQLSTPWLEANLEGRGSTLYATTTGYAELSGPAWPTTALVGNLTLPFKGAVEVPPLPLKVSRDGARFQGGQIQFSKGFPFQAAVPVRINGQAARLEASGNLQSGQLRATTPYGTLVGNGPWTNLNIYGNVQAAGYSGQLSGQADLFKAAYNLRLNVPKLDGYLRAEGKSTTLSYSGQFQGGRLSVSGDYRLVSGKPLDGLRLRAVANGFDTTSFGVPAKISGTWGERGGRLVADSSYGKVIATGTGLLGPLAVDAQTQYGNLRGTATTEALDVRGDLKLPFLTGAVAVRGPWKRLEASGAGRYQLTYLEELPWRLSADVLEQTWRLDGPLQLEGRGFNYRGQIAWPYEFQGRSGELSGSITGKTLDIDAKLRTEYGGIPLSADVKAQGTDLSKLNGTVTLPDGKIQIADKAASFDLETQQIAALFNADVAGRVEGRLELDGSGEARGTLRAYGQQVQVGYQDRAVSAFLPAYKVGARVELGRTLQITGLGNLSGTARLNDELRGRLAYQFGETRVEANLSGSRQEPAFRLSAKGPWGEASGNGSYSLAERGGQAGVRVETAYARGDLELSNAGTKYQLTGPVESLQYLRQTGQLRLSGDGARWSAVWAAPLRLEATGNGAEIASARLNGVGRVEAAGRVFNLSGAISNQGENFAGQIAVSGEGIALNLSGEAGGLRATGEAYGTSVAAKVNREGDLTGKLSYRQALASNQFSAGATLSGTVLKPLLQGQGSLQGKGAALTVSFAYDGVVRASAIGPGLKADYNDGMVKLEANTSLEPFTGLPLRLRTAGQGKLETLELPLTLTGPNLWATGTVTPLKLRAALSGTYEKQKFDLSYDKVLQARLSGPYATGAVRYDKTPTGSLLLDLPVPGGRLAGNANLESGRVSLEGKGGWKGTLAARLTQGWSQPTRWQIQTDLSGVVDLKGQFALDASPLSLQGTGQVGLPSWGQVNLVAQGSQVSLTGAEGLEPLVGKLQLSPLALDWSYAGKLPKNLGDLEARGTYPGNWIQGTYANLGQSFSLSGREDRLAVDGRGLQASLTSQGLSAKLQNFTFSSLVLNGNIEGSWNALQAGLGWKAFGREGQIQAAYKSNVLEATLKGDLAGTLKYAKTWSGALSFREGKATLSGEGIPTIQGQVLGFGVRLTYPTLEVSNPSQTTFKPASALQAARKPDPATPQVIQAQAQPDHLTFNLVERSASGELAVSGVAVNGQGPTLEATYPLAGGRIAASLDLNTYALTVGAPGLGQGNLTYEGGKLGGNIDAALFGLELSLKGEDDRVTFSGTHPDTGWLPWKGGSLSGQVALDGSWQASYKAEGGDETLEAKGKLLEASLSAKGRWLNGLLEYGAGGAWAGSLGANLPLPVLDSRASLQVQGKGDLTAQGRLEGGVGTLNLTASLGKNGPSGSARFTDLNLTDVPLVTSRIPFLEGRTSGRVDYSPSAAKFSLSSPALSVKNDDLQLATKLEGNYQNGVLQANVDFGRARSEGLFDGDAALGSSRSRISVRMDNKSLSGEAAASAFPLHWLLSAWVGDLAGQAYWTGKASFNYNLRDPWASKGILVGQNLRFEGGGDVLAGRSVLRFENERLYIDELALSGKGTWRGSGYWGRERSNFRLDLENTSFTPVLQVIPNLKPYAPEGSGTLRVRSDGQVFDLNLENFRFKLGPVRAETPRARLQVGQTAVAEGTIRLTAPYVAQATLSGEGNADGLVVRARGSANLPLLSPNEPFELSFSYPSYVLDARLINQQARLNGTLFPRLALALQGPVPVSYPQYFLLDGLVNTNLVLNYDGREYRVLGSAEVLRARLGLPQGQKEVSIPASGTGSSSAQSSPVPVQFINVQIWADRGILIQEPLAQGELAGNLYLNGDVANPYLSGEVVPIRGSFKLWNRDFTIRDRGSAERSYARFSPDAGILPELQVVADTQVQDQARNNETVRVNLTLKGQFMRQNGKIKVDLDPAFVAQTASGILTQAEVYSLLLLSRSDLSVLPNDVVQSGLQGVVQNFLVGQLETELGKALGLDQVKVDIPLLGGGRVEETRFTIGKYLSPELFLAYSVDLRGYQTLNAEYRQGDYSFRISTDIVPTLRPTFSLGYSIRPIGADLTVDISTPSTLNNQSVNAQPDGFRFGVGLTFRF
ncbi:MAG: translocation/assembly module TamB, partial [Meiothermus sp.]